MPSWTAPGSGASPCSSVARRRCGGWPPRGRTRASSTRVPAARPIATCVALPRWRRPGVDEEPEEGDDRQHHPAGEPLEHHRGEGRRRLAVVARQAADPEHVAADRGGQHVGHELAGQVVRQQPPEAGVLAHAPRAPPATRAADSTMPASVSSVAPASQSAVERFHSGRSGLCESPILVRRNHSITPLSAMRNTSTSQRRSPARPGLEPRVLVDRVEKRVVGDRLRAVGWVRLLRGPSPGHPYVVASGTAGYRSWFSLAARVDRGPGARRTAR